MGSSLLFGLMAFLAKRATAEVTGAEAAFLRFVVGAAACAGAVAAGRRLRPVNRRGLLLRGVFGGLAVLAYFAALEHLPVGTATLLTYTSPIFTALFASLYLGERAGRATGVTLALTAIGVALVVRGGASPGHLGFGRWELVGLSSAALSGAAVTTIRDVRRTDGAWEIFAAFCAIGALATAPFAIAQWRSPSATGWALLVAVGLLAVGAQLLMNHALREVRAATAGVISQLTPVAALALGVGLGGDRPTATSLLGSALTVGGVAWAALSARAPARS